MFKLHTDLTDNEALPIFLWLSHKHHQIVKERHLFVKITDWYNIVVDSEKFDRKKFGFCVSFVVIPDMHYKKVSEIQFKVILYTWSDRVWSAHNRCCYLLFFHIEIVHI